MSAIGGKADIVRRHYFRVLQTSAGVSYTRLFFSACSASFSQAAAIFRSRSLFLRSEVLSAISVHIAACSRYAATVSLTGICAPTRLFTHPGRKTAALGIRSRIAHIQLELRGRFAVAEHTFKISLRICEGNFVPASQTNFGPYPGRSPNNKTV